MEVVNYTENNESKNFYPTPRPLAYKMLEGIDFHKIGAVLDPSAGKGDLVDAYIEKREESMYSPRLGSFDCIELDSNLRAILSTHNTAHVVHDDFMTFNTYKRYDLILMNPPFEGGDRHLLKAISMQERNGGSIRCILNAQTLKNPFSTVREVLLEKLEKYNAEIEYIEDAFSEGERKTDVEIAFVKIDIPTPAEEGSFFEGFAKAYKEKLEKKDEELNEVGFNDWISQLVRDYEVEVASTIKLIQEFQAFQKRMPSSLRGEGNPSILTLQVAGNGVSRDVEINEYLERVRYKYWHHVMGRSEITGKLTSKIREQYVSKIEKMVDYDFSLFNLEKMINEINSKVMVGIKDSITSFFDKLTIEHTYHKEVSNNKHLFNGWKTNKAHYVNQKVILPTRKLFDTGYSWSTGKMQEREVLALLLDIEKVFKYLTGTVSKDTLIEEIIKEAVKNNQTRNIELEFFTCTFYKKGTVHIKFNSKELVDRFNIFVAQERGWLPPTYGESSYEDMNEEEREVVDSFQGKEAYDKVMANKSKYLVKIQESGQMLLGG